MNLGQNNNQGYFHHSFITNDAYNSSWPRANIHIPNIFWIILVVAASIYAFLMGGQADLITNFALCAALPALIVSLMEEAIGRDWGEALSIFLWTSLALCGVAVTGGALSPLSVLFAIAPMTALAQHQVRHAVEATCFGVIGYIGAVGLSVLQFFPASSEAVLSLAGYGGLIGIIQIGILAATIGSRIQIGEALKRSTRVAQGSISVSHIIDALPIVILDIDDNGCIRAALGNCDGLLGIHAEGCAGLFLHELAIQAHQSEILNISSQALPIRFSPIGKETTYLEAQMVSHTYGRCVILIDANLYETRESASNEIINQAHRLIAEKTHFFASIGHEMRTPLNAVIGFSEILKAEIDGKLDKKMRERAKLIHQGSQHLLLLVEDILAIAQVEAGLYKLDKQSLNLHQSAEEAILFMSDQAANKNIRLSLLSEKPAWIEADARSMRHIWLNLLANAIKFSPENSEVLVNIMLSGQQTILQVTDSGIGMSEEDLQYVGQPFYRSPKAKHHTGSGLGLNVVNTLARRHDGALYIKSAPDEGTTISVSLPSSKP